MRVFTKLTIADIKKASWVARSPVGVCRGAESKIWGVDGVVCKQVGWGCKTHGRYSSHIGVL